MNARGLLTVVREQRFEEECAGIQPNVQRMDEALRYVEEELARQPESGIESSVPGIWVAPVRVPSSENKIVRASIFYTFDMTNVRLQSMRLAT
jgi:hypothetical protein